jgi:hypothetical protein
LNEVCLPRQASFDAIGNPIIELCDCFSTTAGCGPVDIQPNVTIGYTVSCPGPCPIPEACELHFNGIPQGLSTIDSSQIPAGAAVTCACVVPPPILCPLPATQECAALQARDCQTLDPTNENCLPKVIRRNTGQVFFPPTEGIDILTQTTGYVMIKEPGGMTTSYPIRESPNMTRVIRESPVDDPDGHRMLATEIIEMQLMAGGGGGGGGAIMIRESPTRASNGRVDGPISAATDYPANSFFDLYVEIDIPDMGIYGLWNNDPIRLEAQDIVAMPPLGSSFKTPMSWQPIELLESGGAQTGYWIVEVRHDPPPPPPPEWEVILCDCIDPAACHVTQEFSVIPSCAGGCQNNEICTQIITYGPGTVDYSCQCVQAPLEACCFVDGHCEMLLAANCLLIDGTPQGPGTTCSLLQEACCLPNGTCMMTDPLCCDDLGGTRMGPGSQCTAPQACCFAPPNPFCTEMDPLCCVAQGGTPGGPGSTCIPEACCLPDGTCTMTAACLCTFFGGTPKGVGTSCLGDNSGNGIDDFCEILDKVVCEPQGGLNPFHPPTYWYDVTPTGFGRCDFHVRVFDPNAYDYTNWSINPYPWPAGSWAFLVHKVGTEWWASWWDTDPMCSHAFFVKTRFQFDNRNASTWGDWTTTISNTSDPYNQVVDRSANHPAEPDGNGYRVHVPKVGASKWDQWPDASLPGLHAANGTVLADNWECGGGLVTDLHWWGNYELLQGQERRGAGIQCINLSIHSDNPASPWCLPQEPALWGVCAVFSELKERDTGMVNNEGSKIYEYTFYLNPGWPQITGHIYWLDVEA